MERHAWEHFVQSIACSQILNAYLKFLFETSIAGEWKDKQSHNATHVCPDPKSRKLKLKAVHVVAEIFN